jgi:hypothetical protein
VASATRRLPHCSEWEPPAAVAAVETELEVRLRRAGAVLPMIVRDKLRVGGEQ